MADTALFQTIAEYFSKLIALIVSSVAGEGGAGVTNVIIGNAASGCAMITDSVSGAVKTQKKILLVQTASQVFYVISSLALKGYSATVQNAVAIVRNIVAIRGRQSQRTEFILIAVPVLLGIFLNNRGVVGLLPVMASLEYSIAVFRYETQPVKLKLAFVVYNAMFTVFNLALLNFVGSIAGIVIITTTVISVIKEGKGKNTDKKQD